MSLKMDNLLERLPNSDNGGPFLIVPMETKCSKIGSRKGKSFPFSLFSKNSVIIAMIDKQKHYYVLEQVSAEVRFKSKSKIRT